MLLRLASHRYGGLSVSMRLLLAVLLCLSLATPAQADVLRFDRLTIEDGLSQSNVFALAEDSNGHLWFGTESALDRYDGYEFQTHRSDPDDPNTLSFGRIYVLDSSAPDALWVGTGLGLDRMDLRTERIQRFPTPPTSNSIIGSVMVDHQCPDQPLALTSQGELLRADPTTQRLHATRWPDDTPHAVRRIERGPEGRLWLATTTGLWRWHCEHQTLEHLATTASAPPHYGSSTGLLSVAPDGRLLAATPTGLHVYDPYSGELLGVMDPRQHGFDSSIVHAVNTDQHGGVWLRLPTDLVRIAPGRLLRAGPWTTGAHFDEQRGVINHRHALRIATSGDGRVWVAGSFGLYTYQPGSAAIKQVQHDPARSDSLPQSVNEAGHELLADRFGVVWVGTHLGGVVRYVPERHRFASLQSPMPSSDIIRGVSEVQHDDQIWLFTGVDDGGISMWHVPTEGPPELHHQFSITAPAPRTLPSNHIRSLKAQPDQAAVWAWGDHWLGRIDVAEQRFELVAITGTLNDRYRSITAAPNQNRLLVHTRHDLFWVDLDHRPEPPNSAPRLTAVDWMQRVFGEQGAPAIAATEVLSDGRIVIGLRNGWVLYDPIQQRGEHHLLAPDQPWGSSNSVITLLEGSDNTLWVGTHDGLARVDLSRVEVDRWWRNRDGLPDQTIYAILPESSARLWLSTNRGLVRLDTISGQVETFGRADGLRNYEFNSRVGQAGPSGHFYFGGVSGLIRFRPHHIRPHPTPPDVRLQRLRVNEESVPLNSASREFTLKHNENNVVFEFVGLHYMTPHRNQYSYRLDGLEADWIEFGTQRQVRYSSLNPGRYTFWVRAANADGIWSEPTQLASVTIKPPLWLTQWAYLTYASLLLLLIINLVMASNRRKRQLEALVAQRTSELDHKNEMVRRQAKELEQVLAARTTLFANISHEFRTPLTLIQAALHRLEEQRDHPKAIPLAQRYTKRLTRLVDQLLDLSRLRMHGVKASSTPWSLAPILRITAEAFENHAAQRGIELKTDIDSTWRTQCDQPSVEKIILNLLTNALKFTPAGGRVSLILSAGEHDEEACITVSDTGPGIPKDQQEIVFERFQRLPSQEMTLIEGAGIGLALVREAAQAVGGRVQLISEPGQGCTFKVYVPALAEGDAAALQHSHFQSTERLALDAALLDERAQDEAADAATAQPSYGKTLGTLLLVEDNRDLRDYLTTLLSRDWMVVPAVHGEEALERLEDQAIDVIVSDIMMPRMDGLELLRRVRSELPTSHIPFLILSARRDAETRIAGLSMAADDFLTKPFDATELRLKLRNMAERRRNQTHQLRQELQTQAGQSAGSPQVNADIVRVPSTSALSPRDQRFAERVKQWLSHHHDNAERTIAEMARDLAVDQRTLQRKIKALFDCAPSECLNEYRINKAQAALLESAKSIQEIAYDCGFNSPKSFSRTFQRHLGCSPSAWRNQHAA